MFYDYNGRSMLQSVQVPCIHRLVADIAEMYFESLCDGDIIQLYVWEDDSDDLVSEILEQICTLEMYDEDWREEFWYDDQVIISITAAGELSVESAHTQDGYLKAPSDFMNYVDADLPYSLINTLDKHEVPILAFDVTECDECSACDILGSELLVDECGKFHGFNYSKELEDGTVEYKSCFTSKELGLEEIKELFELM